MDEVRAGSLQGRFQGCYFPLLSAFSATSFFSSISWSLPFPSISQEPVCMCRGGEVLLSCRVKKGVRRFGDSFLEERRRVAFYCDRLRVLGAPGCLGPRDTWLRH